MTSAWHKGEKRDFVLEKAKKIVRRRKNGIYFSDLLKLIQAEVDKLDEELRFNVRTDFFASELISPCSGIVLLHDGTGEDEAIVFGSLVDAYR